MKKRRHHDAWCKARVAPEAVRDERTLSVLVAGYGLYPTMIHRWNKAFPDGTAGIVERGGNQAPKVDEDTVRALHARIVGLALSNEFLSRKFKPWTVSTARNDRDIFQACRSGGNLACSRSGGCRSARH